MTSVPFITNTGYDKATGNQVIAEENADLVAFGVPYIANLKPRLAFRGNSLQVATCPAAVTVCFCGRQWPQGPRPDAGATPGNTPTACNDRFNAR